ncbi:MAG: DCL family protein [Bryobacteraceae bacterium]
MAGDSVILGDPHAEHHREFPTKHAAILFFRGMLGCYRNGETIRESDAALLSLLLERHPEALQKIGSGIKRFYRDATSKGTDCFWLERHEGPPTDFSYKTCVEAKGKTLYQELAEACREAMQPDMDLRKKEHFDKFGDNDGKVECEITGEKVAIDESSRSQEADDFEVIVHTFIAANKLEITPEMLSRPGDCQFAVTFADKEIEGAFRTYHATIAKLRIITANANLRLAGSERMIPPKRPVTL